MLHWNGGKVVLHLDKEVEELRPYYDTDETGYLIPTSLCHGPGPYREVPDRQNED